MPRILLLTPRISGVGGIAQHVRQLARRLRRSGYEVEILSSESMELHLRKGVANIGYAISAALKSISGRFDIVHGHNLPAAIPAKIVKAKARILTIHGIYWRQIKLLYGRLLGEAARLAERQLLSGMDAVTTVTLEAMRYYRSLGLKVKYIPNAIDLSELPREYERISSPQITYLGRLSKEKGADLLVEAALRGLKGLVIAGDGPLRPLIEYAARKGLLTFLGALPRWRALRILAGSDVAILPSREEGVSTVLLEAMALRIPIVATRVCGTIEVVRDGRDAILVNPRAEELVEATNRLLEDRVYARMLAENAYQRVVSIFNWDVIQEAYLRLYESML